MYPPPPDANMCSCTSSCTATRPSRSWTAPRCPTSSCPRRWHWAMGARADRPQLGLGLDGVRRRGPGAGPAGDPRRRGRPRRRPPPHAAASRTRAGGATSAGSSRARTRTRATARPGRRPPSPRVPLETVLDHAEGLVCLSGCAAARRPRRADAAPAARAPSGRERLRVELQRPFAAPRPRPQPRARGARAAARGARAWPPATCTRTRAARAGCRTRSWRCASTPRSTPPSRCGAATSATCWPRPQAMAARFADHPEAVRRDRCGSPSGCASTSRSDLGYRYPGAEDDGADAQAGRALPARAATSATPARRRRRASARSARLEEELRIIDALGPGRLLPAAPRHARAGARGRGRGARPRHARARCCRPGAGAARASPRSSATSPASRTSTRSPTSCCSGASSTRS